MVANKSFYHGKGRIYRGDVVKSKLHSRKNEDLIRVIPARIRSGMFDIPFCCLETKTKYAEV